MTPDRQLFTDLKIALINILFIAGTLALYMCSEPSPQEKKEINCIHALDEQLSQRQVRHLIHGANGLNKSINYSLMVWYCRKIGPENVQEKITWAKRYVKKGF